MKTSFPPSRIGTIHTPDISSRIRQKLPSVGFCLRLHPSLASYNCLKEETVPVSWQTWCCPSPAQSGGEERAKQVQRNSGDSMGPQSGLQIMASSSCYIPCASGGRRSTLCSNVNQKHILKSHLWHSTMRINSSKWDHEIKYVSGRGLLASVFLSWWSRSKYWSSILPVPHDFISSPGVPYACTMEFIVPKLILPDLDSDPFSRHTPYTWLSPASSSSAPNLALPSLVLFSLSSLDLTRSTVTPPRDDSRSPQLCNWRCLEKPPSWFGYWNSPTMEWTPLGSSTSSSGIQPD